MNRLTDFGWRPPPQESFVLEQPGLGALERQVCLPGQSAVADARWRAWGIDGRGGELLAGWVVGEGPAHGIRHPAQPDDVIEGSWLPVCHGDIAASLYLSTSDEKHRTLLRAYLRGSKWEVA